jgi:hypothetical protein
MRTSVYQAAKAKAMASPGNLDAPRWPFRPKKTKEILDNRIPGGSTKDKKCAIAGQNTLPSPGEVGRRVQA